MISLSRLALTMIAATIAAAGIAPCRAQSLIHRYSFNGNANDSVGSANGTVVGSVALQSSSLTVNGSADFGGTGTSGNSPSYISLPISTVRSLQNATLEFFTTNFNPPKNQGNIAGGQYQTLFSFAQAYGTTKNFVNLTPNFAGTGLGYSAGRNGKQAAGIVAHDPYPDWQTNHIVDYVFKGFTSPGATGSVTIFEDGRQVASGATKDSFSFISTGAGGVSSCGIGGGSPFNDPTFSGSMNEARIYAGALTSDQIAANAAAGPAVLLPIVLNSSFETPLVGTGAPGYIYRPTGAKWTFTGKGGIQENGSSFKGWSAPDGGQTAFLQGTGGAIGGMTEQVTFPAAGTYQISLELAQCAGYGIEPIKVAVDGSIVSASLAPTGAAFAIVTSAPFTVTKAGAHTVHLAATTGAGNNITLIDEVCVTTP